MLIKKIKAALTLITALLLTGTVSSCSSENTTSAESDTVTEIITVSNTNEDNISADNALTKKVTAVNYSSGDVTGDGIIDATDASLILTSYAKTSAGGKDEMNDEQKKYADVNKDGVVDAIDASVVLTYYAKSSSGYKESFEAFIQSFNEPSVEETPSGNELQLYAPILDYFYKNISEKWANYKCIDQEYPQYNIKVGTQGANISSIELVSDYIIRNIKDKSLDEIGYQFIDINNDGTKELVIAEIWSNSGSLWATVACDLYTIKDNNIVHLAASGPRDRFSVSKNNLIVEEGSGGMYLSSNTYYSLSDGMLKPVKEYKLDQNTFKDTNWHYSDSYVNNSFTNWIISDKNTDNTEFIIFEPTPFSSYSFNSGSNTDTGSANSEITETAGSYKWYIEPSVKADDIMSSDYCGNDNNYETSVISDYSVIKNNDKYGIITYDGDYIYNEIYDNVYYDIGNIIFSNNSSYDRLVVCHDGSTRTDTPWGSGFTKKYFYCNNQIMIGDDIYVPSYDNSAAYEELKNKIVSSYEASTPDTLDSIKEKIFTKT